MLEGIAQLSFQPNFNINMFNCVKVMSVNFKIYVCIQKVK